MKDVLENKKIIEIRRYSTYYMHYKTLLTLCLLITFGLWVTAQTPATKDSTTVISQDLPPIDYGQPKEYTIAGIEVEGAEAYDDFVLIGFSGLAVE